MSIHFEVPTRASYCCGRRWCPPESARGCHSYHCDVHPCSCHCFHDILGYLCRCHYDYRTGRHLSVNDFHRARSLFVWLVLSLWMMVAADRTRHASHRWDFCPTWVAVVQIWFMNLEESTGNDNNNNSYRVDDNNDLYQAVFFSLLSILYKTIVCLIDSQTERRTTSVFSCQRGNLSQ